MNIYCIKHVEFENPAMIEDWARENGHDFGIIKIYDNDKFPDIINIDMLVVMGGPMNIYEYDKYTWLKKEKIFIKEVIEKGKKVIGVCLGAQLIADVLGGKVTKGKDKEIGWFEIDKITEESYFFKDIGNKLKVFHWHGDTFEIPKGAKHIFKSEACENQAFEYENRVLGLQFHMEMKEENIEIICKECADELNEEGKYIQSYLKIREDMKLVKTNKEILYTVLEKFKK